MFHSSFHDQLFCSVLISALAVKIQRLARTSHPFAVATAQRPRLESTVHADCVGHGSKHVRDSLSACLEAQRPRRRKESRTTQRSSPRHPNFMMFLKFCVCSTPRQDTLKGGAKKPELAKPLEASWSNRSSFPPSQQKVLLGLYRQQSLKQ